MPSETRLPLNVRHAKPDDEDILFSWRNDPWVASQGLGQKTVTSEEHHIWFLQCLKREIRELFIVEIKGIPSGMVRYDCHVPDEAEISIYILPPYPGHGYGRDIFLATAPQIFVNRSIKQIRARVLSDNERSLKWFRGLGFQDTEVNSASSVYTLLLERPHVSHSRPWIGDRETDAVASVIASRQIAQGPKVHELEERWSQVTGKATAAAVGSGVAALRLALLALDIGSGDEVIVPAYSCVALFNAVLSLGATPVLSDVIDGQWTLSPKDVESRLNPRTKAIIVVHLFGHPASIEQISDLGLPVIEDCAHGIGGLCNTRPFGGSGTLNIASFYATKMISAGEGGIVAGDNAKLIDRVREARDYGDQAPNGHHLNDKMTDIEATLALTQLDRLPENLRLRNEAALQYSSRLRYLSDRGLLTLPINSRGRIWYRYTIKLTRHLAAQVADQMANAGVRAERPVWDFRDTISHRNEFEVTSSALDRVLSLPLYPDLTALEQELVCSVLAKSLES